MKDLVINTRLTSLRTEFIALMNYYTISVGFSNGSNITFRTQDPGFYQEFFETFKNHSEYEIVLRRRDKSNLGETSNEKT